MAFLIAAAQLVAANPVGTKGRKNAVSGAYRRFPFARTRVLQLVLAVAFSTMLGSVPGLRGQASLPSEDQVKAAFIYNFAKFVEWPPAAFAEAGSPIIIGVAGDASVEDTLDRYVKDKTVEGRKLLVGRWKQGQSSPRCHILFIGSTVGSSHAEILRNIRGSPVLTVGETDGFAQQGGMINFILTDNKVGFEINRKNAESAGLKISSKLLALAKTVWE